MPPIHLRVGGPLEGVGPETYVHNNNKNNNNNNNNNNNKIEYRIQNTDTYVHNITNVPVFYMVIELND
jgi:hypothetical protein